LLLGGRQLGCRVLSVGRRIVLSWGFLDNPTHAGVSLKQDLEGVVERGRARSWMTTLLVVEAA